MSWILVDDGHHAVAAPHEEELLGWIQVVRCQAQAVDGAVAAQIQHGQHVEIGHGPNHHLTVHPTRDENLTTGTNQHVEKAFSGVDGTQPYSVDSV